MKYSNNKFKITEEDLRKIVSESVKKILMESDESWYDEEDENGKTGHIGQMKSYDTGYITRENAEIDAKECGFENVGEYLKYWFDETWPHEFSWEDIRGGYGFNGEALFDEDGLRIKDIYGQIMFDEYPN